MAGTPYFVRAKRFSGANTILVRAKTEEEWLWAAENKIPAWCYYNNDPANGTKYGYLYNWFAATDVKGLCPSGWHLPTEAEWIELKNFLGGSIQAAYNMKDVGTTHWNNTDINVTNESGFTALAGGYRNPFDSGNSKGFLLRSRKLYDFVHNLAHRLSEAWRELVAAR